MDTINQRDNEGSLSDPFTNMIRDSGNGSVEITLDKKWLEVHGYKVGDRLKVWVRKIFPAEEKRDE